MRSSVRVSVAKDYLVFASAHFITFAERGCEPLHGHNYRVGVTLEGTLDEASGYLVDFSVLKAVMRRLCDEIDHRVLLPTANPRLTVSRADGSVAVALDGEPRYVFPEADCVLLPISNTTVEMLARHLAERARAEMARSGPAEITVIELEVEENFGQSATYREDSR